MHDTSDERTSPYDDPDWEPMIVWALDEIETALEFAYPDEVNEIPDLDPLPSEKRLGLRLTNLQYAAAVMASISTVDVDDDYPNESVAQAPSLIMALRHLGFDPVVGVEEWDGWRRQRPRTEPSVADFAD